VDRRSALIFDRLGLRFEEQHRNVFAHQRQRHDGADRSGACHDHAFFVAVHAQVHTLAISNVDG
jgi:hypothetical protein